MDDDREILTPLMGLKRRAEHGGAQVVPGSIPTRALFTWGDPLFEVARTFTHAKPIDLRAGVAKLWRGSWGGVPITLVNPGMGAPAAAIVADKLAACGVDTIVGVGFAGILHPLLSSGDIIVVERAIGEDGASRSYASEDSDEHHATPLIKDALELSLSEENMTFQCGTVWTTDAPYRETVQKARMYRGRGAHAVEMETAALYAVARRRGFRAGSAVVLSDSLCRFATDAAAAGTDGLEWTWAPAPSGSLDQQVSGLVRAALPVVTGPLEAIEAHAEH